MGDLLSYTYALFCCSACGVFILIYSLRNAVLLTGDDAAHVYALIRVVDPTDYPLPFFLLEEGLPAIWLVAEFSYNADST